MSKITKILAVLVAVSALAISAPLAMAATYTWTGSTSNDYFTDGNWDVTGTPGRLDDVVITSGTPEVAGDLDITTSETSAWVPGPLGGKTVALSNATATVNGNLFLGYGGTGTWTQASGTVDVTGTALLGGYNYDNGVAGSGTFTLSDGTAQAGKIQFCGGTQLFDQSGGSVTATSIGVAPPWHQPIFGSYDMNGGELTLTNTTNPIQEPGGEAGTAWRFNFGGGDIYLGGDQSTIADEFFFNVTGDPLLYQATYNSGTDVTHLSYIPEPATLALLAFGGLGVLLRRKRR